MRIIIEDYQYKASDVSSTLRGLYDLESADQKIGVKMVGYFYNPEIGDCVFILPKVLMNADDKAFGHIEPEELIAPESSERLTNEERKFIYSFAVWIYRAIAVYNKLNPRNGIVKYKRIAQMGMGKRRVSNTFLDILLELLRFNRENADYLTFVLKNQHSGQNKINWTRTIARTEAFIRDEVPIYMDPVNRKRQVNFDEELIIIFFSILNYIHEEYGFSVSIAFGFELIKGKMFKRWLDGYGVRRLRQIKYKYFSDKALKMWELCYAFFDNAHKISIAADRREYLIAQNFNLVFEAMIDELIGDKNVPEGLKEQEDGKMVDHLYRYKDLMEGNNDIYYIGDSKYYKIGNQLGREAVYKQYTYARNVIQWNLNLFLDNDAERVPEPRIRDEETEGYNIIPNFFIMANVDETLEYTKKLVAVGEGGGAEKKPYKSRQFENRLFDRDTLLVYCYNVNFLYVLALYARNNASQKREWKKEVRDAFRKRIQDELNRHYDFYAMRARQDVRAKDFIEEHFKDINGKVYKPFDDEEIYSLALEHSGHSKENDELINTLEYYFVVAECPLGGNPANAIEEKSKMDIAMVAEGGLEAGRRHVMLIGHSDNMEEVMEKGQYRIRLLKDDKLYNPNTHFMDVELLLLHKAGKERRLFKIEGSPEFKLGSEVKGDPQSRGVYIVYKLGKELRIADYNISEVRIYCKNRQITLPQYVVI